MKKNNLEKSNDNKKLNEAMRILFISLVLIGAFGFVCYQLFIAHKDIRADILLFVGLLLLNILYFVFKRDFSVAKLKFIIIEAAIVSVIFFM